MTPAGPPPAPGTRTRFAPTGSGRPADALSGGPPDGDPGPGATRRLRRLSPSRLVPTRLRRPRTFVPLLVVVALVAGGLWFWQPWDGGPVPLTGADVDKRVADALEKAQAEQRNAPPDAVAVYQTILPSLVTVTAAGTGKAGTDTVAGTSLGTGVVVNADGTVLTALHVVAGGGAIEVRFADGTKSAAKVARAREDDDIAVLSVATLPQVVVPAVLGGGVQVGDAVYPVGNPLGLEGSLSAGVVSALGRSVRTEADKTLDGLIQFDAAVNPGNSGGPLLDRNAQVVGIVTGLANPSRQPYFVGIGFAVPIATAGGAAGGPSV